MMNRVTVFRALLGLFVTCYAVAFFCPGSVDLSRNPELRAYLEQIDVMYGGFRPDLFWVFWLWLLGQVVAGAGLVLLFGRSRWGLWPACVGAALSVGASWFVAWQEHDPVLQTGTLHLLSAAIYALWGSVVCMALTDRHTLFVRPAKP